jgi:hypothetical protein
MPEAICLLDWRYRGRYTKEEPRKSQHIPEPGQFILHDHCFLDPSLVINNCHFFVAF